MIRLYPEQLPGHIKEGLRAAYLLIGHDPLLLQESEDEIYRCARRQSFTEQYHWQVDNNTDWQAIFACCTAMSLFASRQSLCLVLPESGINASMHQQLARLVSLLHDDLLLIIRLPKLNKAVQASPWFGALTHRAAMVACQTPERGQLTRWLASRARRLNLSVDDAALQLLCYCYEGNLLALSQALERLSLLWQDGKLTLPRVEQAVNDAACFTAFHWVDALLAGKSKRALHALQQLRQQGIDAVILLRTLQRELLQLVRLKRQTALTPLPQLFDQQRIWKNRRALMSDALHRLSWRQLRQAVQVLSRCELTLKQDFAQSVWAELSELSLLLTHSGGALPEVLAHG